MLVRFVAQGWSHLLTFGLVVLAGCSSLAPSAGPSQQGPSTGTSSPPVATSAIGPPTSPTAHVLPTALAPRGRIFMLGDPAEEGRPLRNWEALWSGELRVVTPDGTGERVIAPNLRGVMSHGPLWNTTGDHGIIGGYGSTVIVHADGSPHTALSPNTGHMTSCADWSPDGRRLVYLEDSDIASQPETALLSDTLALINADGTGFTRLATFPATACPRWSPDGRRLAEVSFHGLRIIELDGTTTLIPFPAPFVAPEHADVRVLGTLTWSPDGRWIAFSLNEAGAIISADGTTMQRLGAVASFSDVTWSPTSRALVFQQQCASRGKECPFGDDPVFVADTDGSAPRRLAIGGGLLGQRSPDGRYVLFTDDHQLYRIATDGSEILKIAAWPAVLIDFPSWSPSGTQISFSEQVGTDAPPRSNLSVVNADGTHLTDILAGRAAYETQPSWSPDGAFLTFTRWDEHGPRVWVCRSDGSDARMLIDEPRFMPMWLPGI